VRRFATPPDRTSLWLCASVARMSSRVFVSFVSFVVAVLSACQYGNCSRNLRSFS
jgi:hypothetical protein